MPSNVKTFTDIHPAEYQDFRQALRSLSWTAPHSEKGTLRSSDGLFADLDFNEPEKSLTIRVRDLPKGHTHASFFDKIQSMLQQVDR